MQNSDTHKTDRQLISDSFIKSIRFMGLSKTDLSDILMTDLSNLNRSLEVGIEPSSLKGQVSLLIIKIYFSLFALSGNNKSFMKHFLYTESNHFEARPVDSMKSVKGLVRVDQYLDAMRGKV